MNNNQFQQVLRRGVAEIIVESEFTELLKQGKRLRLKMGFDPSAPDLHLGHAVGLRKLRQLQDLGHTVVVIVGDWTAQIGDPSGRSVTRPVLTAEEVKRNAETYMAQFFKIVDKDKTETRWQSEWFGNFNLKNVVGLTSKFTVAQILARDDFAKRFRANMPIAVTELLYPLLQAYDSVVVRSDVEFGGTDQKFNLLVGRELQVMMGQSPQQCFMVPILVGTDGAQKMGKSLKNYIGLAEPANDMYLKVMRLPDNLTGNIGEGTLEAPQTQNGSFLVKGNQSLILMYMSYLTNIPDREIEEMRQALEGDSVNPMELKKKLARELVTQFHGAEAARGAETFFEKTVQHKEVASDVDVLVLPTQAELENKRLSRFLVEANLVASASEARRLIAQGGIQVDGHKITNDSYAGFLATAHTLRVGKQKTVKLETSL